MAPIKKYCYPQLQKTTSQTEAIRTDITCTKIYTSEVGKSPTCFGTSSVPSSGLIGIIMRVQVCVCFCPLIVQRKPVTGKPP